MGRELTSWTMLLCSFLVVALYVRDRQDDANRGVLTFVQDWQELATNGHELLRPDSTAVTIVAFVDFLCPYCADMKYVLDSLNESSQGTTRIVLRHFPLETLHPGATDAAVAFECAAARGRASEFYDRLFHAPDLSIADHRRDWLVSLATEVGIRDTLGFEQCLDADESRARVERDAQVGRSLGVTGTPTILVNGRPVVGYVPHAVLEGIIRSALATQTRQ